MSFESGLAAPQEFIPLCIPEIRGNEWKYVQECLDSGWVSSVGSFVDRFEQGLAAYVGAKHAVATVNGTAALHIALLVAGIQSDDEVLVSTLTFIASANPIRYVGAWPVFIDAEPQHWQMDPQKVTDFLEQECRWTHGELRDRATGRRVRGILPVHILGHPVDIDPILEVARKYDLVVIEDATESLGTRYKGRNVGTLGHAACFSFNGNKVITTGGGGMFVTNNPEWAERAKYLTTQARDSSIEYIHSAIGYNYRLTNIQAAMGVAQLEQLNEYIALKRKHAEAYSAQLSAASGITVPSAADWAFCTFWLYTIRINRLEYGLSARDLITHLRTHNIESRPLWMPMHLTPVHQNLSRAPMPVAEHLYEQAVSLPSSVGLTDDAQQRVINAVKELGVA